VSDVRLPRGCQRTYRDKGSDLESYPVMVVILAR